MDAKAVVILIIMTLLWGFNDTAIKYSDQGVSADFASTLCSVIPFICGLMTLSSMIGLPIVSMGIFMVTWRRRTPI